jgi:hypothetical protein
MKVGIVRRPQEAVNLADSSGHYGPQDTADAETLYSLEGGGSDEGIWVRLHDMRSV